MSKIGCVQLHSPEKGKKCAPDKILATLVRRRGHVDHYTRPVSEWTKDNTVSFGLRDMTRRFRECLGR